MNKLRSTRVYMTLVLVTALACVLGAQAPDADVAKKLEGFDEYMARVLKDWRSVLRLRIDAAPRNARVT